MTDVEFYSSKKASLLLDARHFPVAIVTWSGTPDRATLKTSMEWLARLYERAVEENVAFVIVSDISRLRRLNAAARAMLARNINVLTEREPGRFLGVLAIVNSALVRAALAALLLMLRHKLNLTTVGSLSVAIERARAMLGSAGTLPPAGLEPHGYRPPPWPDETLDEVQWALRLYGS